MLNERTRLWSIIACIASTMTVSITLGITWPLLAIVLERQGVPPWLNGLSASAQTLAVLAVVPFAPRLIGAFGIVRMVAIGIAITVACLVLLPLFPNVWAWFPIRFALGFGEELVFISTDVWINQLARDNTRGRLIGTYGMFLLAGFAIGPMTLMTFGSENWTVLYIGIAVVLFGLLPLVAARGTTPAIEGEPRARLRYYLRVATTLMVAGLMFGLINSSVESLLTVYGLEKGLDEGSATFLLLLLVIGSILGQLPSGWLADHYDHVHILAASCALTLLSMAMLPLALEYPALKWPVMLTMGASIGAFYVVAMTMMGQRYRGAELIGINTSFIFFWGIGSAAGPALSGSAITLLGPDGMPAVGVVLCVAFLTVCVRQIRRDKQAES